MKKLILFILITTLSYAQETKFTFKKEGFTDYVVTQVSGTQSEIYSKTVNWIKETYKNPDEVIKMSIENEKVRFQGLKSKFNCYKAMASSVCSDAIYTIEVSFKDGKYKFDVIELVITANGNSFTPDLNDLSIYYKKNGELAKSSESVPASYENLFNDLNESLKQYVTETKKSDW